MPDVTEIPQAEAFASIRAQVRNQIKSIHTQKANLPGSIARLKAVVAQENVQAAFGDEIKAVNEVVSAL